VERRTKRLDRFLEVRRTILAFVIGVSNKELVQHCAQNRSRMQAAGPKLTIVDGKIMGTRKKQPAGWE